eukprot:gene15051-20251_t
MGAAGSVKLVYAEAIEWFQLYFDSALYIEDFRAIDKNHDGEITYQELESWIKRKATKENGAWSKLYSNQTVIQIAHNEACNSSKDQFVRKSNGGVFLLEEFRYFLIHLFAISILWAHFTGGNNGNDTTLMDRKTLNFEEFQLACTTFCSTHLAEDLVNLTAAQLKTDFYTIDTDHNNLITFLEVSNYCCRFIYSGENLVEGQRMSAESLEIATEKLKAANDTRLYRRSFERNDAVLVDTRKSMAQRRSFHNDTPISDGEKTRNSSFILPSTNGSFSVPSLDSMGSSFSISKRELNSMNRNAIDALVHEIKANSKSAKAIRKGRKGTSSKEANQDLIKDNHSNIISCLIETVSENNSEKQNNSELLMESSSLPQFVSNNMLEGMSVSSDNDYITITSNISSNSTDGGGFVVKNQEFISKELVINELLNDSGEIRA